MDAGGARSRHNSAGGSRSMTKIRSAAWAAVSLVRLLLLACGHSGAQGTAVTINVDAAANKHAISPLIYGVAHAGTAALSDLNAPLNRNGGNNTSRYNWQQNADNRGNDWYYESIADTS